MPERGVMEKHSAKTLGGLHKRKVQGLAELGEGRQRGRDLQEWHSLGGERRNRG